MGKSCYIVYALPHVAYPFSRVLRLVAARQKECNVCQYMHLNPTFDRIKQTCTRIRCFDTNLRIKNKLSI